MFGGSNKEAKVTIYYTSIDEVDGSAGCSIGSDGAISARSFDVDASSGSSINLEIEGNVIEITFLPDIAMKKLVKAMFPGISKFKKVFSLSNTK